MAIPKLFWWNAEVKACARFHWQPSCKIASSVWMEVSLQEETAAISSGDKKGAGEEHSKGSFHTPWKDGKKTSLPARKDMITFNCKLFSVSYSNHLSANEAENLPQTYGGGILPWPQISLVGVATLD